MELTPTITRALDKMEDAKTARSKIEAKPEWEGHPMWEEFKDNWKKKETAFYENANKKQIEEMLRDKTSYAFTLYDQAINTVRQQGLYQGM